MSWICKQTASIPTLNNPILIEGMPGIGNVGKIVADFIVEQLQAVKLYELYSYNMPHSVFINDKNLVELPSIEIYYKKFTKKDGKKQDLFFLTGDIQPIDEVSCYAFCDLILDIFEKFKAKYIITIGGIGLPEISATPKVYCTGNNQEIIKQYCTDTKLRDQLYGIIGPIIGVTGVLVGVAGRRNIPAICLLAETLAHPMYLGVNGAKEIVRLLNQKLALNLRVENLDKEIMAMEEEMLKTTKKLEDVAKKAATKMLTTDANYIG